MGFVWEIFTKPGFSHEVSGFQDRTAPKQHMQNDEGRIASRWFQRGSLKKALRLALGMGLKPFNLDLNT